MHVALRPPSRRITPGRVAGRSVPRARRWWLVVLWTVLWIAHAPSWLGALWAMLADPDPLHALRFLILTLSQIFFVLKACDVQWLRLSPRRGAWFAAVLVVVLLHSDVMRRYVAPDSGLPTEYAVVLAGSGALALLTHQRYPLAHRIPRADETQPKSPAVLPAARRDALAEVWPLRLALLVRACRLDRAPPAPACAAR